MHKVQSFILLITPSNVIYGQYRWDITFHVYETALVV